MCGKNKLKPSTLIPCKGSPPRVREERTDRRIDRTTSRITPACAGDHPRVCGKNFFKSSIRLCAEGSPPRVREELSLSATYYLSVGITPACAGRTITMQSEKKRVRDHPRVCGKNKNLFTRKSVALGSPPRVREELL